MPYRMTAINLHKKRLAVLVADVEESEYRLERRWRR